MKFKLGSRLPIYFQVYFSHASVLGAGGAHTEDHLQLPHPCKGLRDTGAEKVRAFELSVILNMWFSFIEQTYCYTGFINYYK